MSPCVLQISGSNRTDRANFRLTDIATAGKQRRNPGRRTQNAECNRAANPPVALLSRETHLLPLQALDLGPKLGLRRHEPSCGSKPSPMKGSTLIPHTKTILIVGPMKTRSKKRRATPKREERRTEWTEYVGEKTRADSARNRQLTLYCLFIL